MGVKLEHVDNTVFVNTEALCLIFHVTRPALSQWKSAGCPQEARGRWDLGKVIAWKSGKWIGAEDGDEEDLKKRQLIAETTFREERARKTALEAGILEGEYYHRDDIAETWAGRVAEVKAALLSLPRRLPVELVGKTEREIKDLIDTEVRGICEQYARESPHTPAHAKKVSGRNRRVASA